jgi:hypothetical protein
VDERSRDAVERVTLVVMTDTPFAPIIETQTALQEAWRDLMGPWSFGGHSVWMMLIVDDRPVPQLTEITESEDPPDADFTESIATMLRMLDREIAPGARFAFLRSRPGLDVITETDRAWATTLYAAARLAAVPCEVVHLATRGAVRPIAQDDVG